jgi:hypothetical protein
MASDYLKNNPGSISQIWQNLDPQARNEIMGNVQKAAPEMFSGANIGEFLKNNPDAVTNAVRSMDPATRTSLINQYMPEIAGGGDMGSMINSYLVGPDGKVDMTKVKGLMSQMSPDIRNQIESGFMGDMVDQNPVMGAVNNVKQWLQGSDPAGSFMSGAQNAGRGWLQQTESMLRNLGDLGSQFGKNFGTTPTPPQTATGTSEIGQTTPPATAAAPTPVANTASAPLNLAPGMKSSFA